MIRASRKVRVLRLLEITSEPLDAWQISIITGIGGGPLTRLLYRMTLKGSIVPTWVDCPYPPMDKRKVYRLPELPEHMGTNARAQGAKGVSRSIDGVVVFQTLPEKRS